MDRVDYYKVTDAARKLGYKRRSNLHYHIKAGHLEAIEDPATGLLLIHRDELERFRYSKYFKKEEAE